MLSDKSYFYVMYKGTNYSFDTKEDAQAFLKIIADGDHRKIIDFIHEVYQ